MAASNPSVSVFHFTQRVSSAKIRKYKLATERGMGGGVSNARVPSPSPAQNGQDATQSPDAANMGRPAKRPRLKLNVRPPDEIPDTIAVSRPKPDSSLKIRYSENMVVDAADRHNMDVDLRKPKPSPAPFSDFSSVHPARNGQTPPKPAEVAPKKSHDYGRDFMSYYVAGGEDDEPDDEVVEVRPPPSKAMSLTQPPGSGVMQQPQLQQSQRQSQPYAEPRVQPPAYPRPALPQPRPTLPQPAVHLIDTTPRAGKSNEPDTVAVMIKKLNALTAALTSFGRPSQGATPSGQVDNNAALMQPQAEVPPPPAASKDELQTTSEKKDVDTFLALFDDDDDDDNDSEDRIIEDRNGTAEGQAEQVIQKETPKVKDPLDYRLQKPGEPDAPLIYGIQFIQNALRSWAQQRLTAQYTQHYMEWQRKAHEHQQPKRGPGRPRRFDVGDDGQHYMAPPPLNIQFDLAKTPEGVAIAAFQDVLDSGCLLINTILPKPLTRALSLMYMQIDCLINQGSKEESKWQCMSYTPQIEAHRVRVEKWMEAHAKHQEEMARQQQIAHQQVIQRMGIHPNHRSQLTAEQAQLQHAIDLERKRSLQHAAQLPHLTNFLTNPLNLDSSRPMNPAPPPSRAPTKLTSAVPLPVQAPVANTPQPAANSAASNPPLNSSPLIDRMPSLERLRNMPHLFSRSGQSMKFSFAPTSELAVKAFGAQAFPVQQTGGYLPNRGPMSANPHLVNSHSYQMANGPAQQSIPQYPSQHTHMAGSTEQKPSQPGDSQVNTPAPQAGDAASLTVNKSPTAQTSTAMSPPRDMIPVASPVDGKDVHMLSSSPRPNSMVVVGQ